MRRAIDGETCVDALIRAGFRVHHRGQHLTLLKRDTHVVLVPSVSEISPDMLTSILRSAGLSARDLEAHLGSASGRPAIFESGAPSSRE